MEIAAGPPCRVQLVPEAAIVVLPEAAVCCPPVPLQCARLTAQVRWDNVPKFVCLRQVSARWQVEALRVPSINRLAIAAGIIRNAIRWGLCTNQRPHIGAIITHCCVADRHLKVTEMVRCDHVLKLGNLPTRVSRSDGFFAVATRTPLSLPPSIQAIVVPRASNWLTQVAVTAHACMTSHEEQNIQSTATAHGCYGVSQCLQG